MGAEVIRQLPAMGRLKPAKQGLHDRLCGLYSIINAIDLVMPPEAQLLPSQRKRLFDDGIAFLARKGVLERVTRSGMNERLWMALRYALIATETGQGAPKLEISTLPTPLTQIGLRELLRWTERQIEQGSPVMLPLWGAYDHYTVVGGTTPTKLLLFDSYGFQHVARESLVIRTPRSEGRHRISRRGVAAIMVRT